MQAKEFMQGKACLNNLLKASLFVLLDVARKTTKMVLLGFIFYFY